MHNKNSLLNDLRHSGILPSDTLLIHSSMKSIGNVDGGADTVIDTIMDYFSPEGLLVFPTLTYTINQENPIFDVNKTPSIVGLLTNIFRLRPGVFRSLHPTHSVAARGKDAVEFTSGHEQFDSPCSLGSPWGKLLQRKAKILFIGTGNIQCNTFIHGVEEWLPVPHVLSETRQRLISIDEHGQPHVVPSRRQQGSHWHYYDKVRPLFFQKKLLKTLSFGDAQCFLIECAPMTELLFSIMKTDPFYFTHE